MDSVYVANEDEFSRKLEALIKDGVDCLHIVSDFDRTLTKGFFDGTKVNSTYQLIRNSGLLDAEYSKKGNDLFAVYHPFEIDASLDSEIRKAKMQLWWEEHYSLMQDYGINKNVIESIACNKEISLRLGVGEFFEKLQKSKIPLLIFSAGMGNVIEYFLSNKNYLTDNVHIISNYFLFDADGEVKGVKKPFIHAFNKNEVEIQGTAYYREVLDRKNVVLLGDSLGDLGMTKGIEHDVILRIGFLNYKKAELLDIFMQKFDVVITGDGSFDYVNRLLDRIIKSSLQ
tara:strand:+ start:102992 stop:103846 length:855 start_codon:yes stop_codon:yes gene_type:complete